MARQGQARRVESALRVRIETGELKPGDELGSEAQLAAEFGVARGTVRAAVSALERDGLLDVVPAKGRYIRGAIGAFGTGAPAARAAEVAAQLRDELENGGYEPGQAFLSEKGVCDRFAVSRYGARLALRELESAGLIVAVHGKGRLVAEGPAAKSARARAGRQKR